MCAHRERAGRGSARSMLCRKESRQPARPAPTLQGAERSPLQVSEFLLTNNRQFGDPLSEGLENNVIYL